MDLRNKDVREEMKKILRFWLDMGVAGFRIDAVPHFFEDESFLDEEIVPGKPIGKSKFLVPNFPTR